MWSKLCADPSLIPAAVEETLRFDTSVNAWRRVATRDTAIGVIPIPAGAKLMLAIGAANHDPRHFPNPDVFDIGRSNAHHQLSFGWGTHDCLGAGPARIEADIALRLLCERLPGLELVPHQEASFPRNITFRGPRELWVQWSVSAVLSLEHGAAES
jgi:cytochrome P450